MALSFQSVALDSGTPDSAAVLVFRDGRLLAVLTCLSDIHADLTGQWFVEATFGRLPDEQPLTFKSQDHFEEWLDQL